MIQENNYTDFIILSDVFISNTTYNMRGAEMIGLSSPNRPQNYNSLENILWHVRNVRGRKFLMTFGTVRMHSIRDYVRLYTGISDVFEESTQIFHLTYNLPGDLLQYYWTVHPNMWLQFSTDAFGTDRGFLILITSSYGGEKQWLCFFKLINWTNFVIACFFIRLVSLRF